MDGRYDKGWSHETPIPDHDADICNPILVAEPEAVVKSDDTGITIDFDADELLSIANAMKLTGETLNEFVSRAIKNAVTNHLLNKTLAR